MQKDKFCPNDDEVNSIMLSIAEEQASLSHMLNAEGEKIQKAVDTEYDLCNLLEISNSVSEAIARITHLDSVLFNKLYAVTQCCCKNCCEEPCISQLCVIAKSGIDNVFLSGVGVKIYDKRGQLIAQGMTGEDGRYCAQNVVQGIYSIEAIDSLGEMVVTEATVDCCIASVIKRVLFGCEEPIPISNYIVVKGRVMDSSNCSVALATVILNAKSQHKTLTDNSGNYSFYNVDSGSKVVVRAIINGSSRTAVMNTAGKNIIEKNLIIN